MRDGYLQNAVRDKAESYSYWERIWWNFWILRRMELKSRVFFGLAFFMQATISRVGGSGS